MCRKHRHLLLLVTVTVAALLLALYFREAAETTGIIMTITTPAWDRFIIRILERV